MLTYLSGLLTVFFDKIPHLLWLFFTDFYGWAFSQLLTLIQQTLDQANFDINLLWAADLWSNLNFFFPINESLSMLTIVFSFWLSVFLVKVILKLIPTIY